MATNERDELRKTLWWNMPSCACCLGPSDKCTADDMCAKCAVFFDNMEKYFAQHTKEAVERELQEGLHFYKGESADPQMVADKVAARLAQLSAPPQQSKETP